MRITDKKKIKYFKMKKIIIISFLCIGCIVYSQKSYDLMLEGISLKNFSCEDAISKFDEAIDTNNYLAVTEESENDYLAMTYFERARCKMKLEKHLEAIKDFTKAIELSNNSKSSRQRGLLNDYYMERGHLKMLLRDYNGAILDYKKGKFGQNRYYLGKAYLGLNKYKEAREYFLNAIDYHQSSQLGYDSRQDVPSYYYYYIGICELNLNLMNEACISLRRAGDLGNEDAIELIVKFCN